MALDPHHYPHLQFDLPKLAKLSSPILCFGVDAQEKSSLNPSHPSIPRGDSPTIFQSDTKVSPQGTRKSRPLSEETDLESSPFPAFASPVRHSSYMLDQSTQHEKRYSAMFLADFETLAMRSEDNTDDLVQKYMDSVRLVSPPPLERAEEPLQPPLLGSLYRTR